MVPRRHRVLLFTFVLLSSAPLFAAPLDRLQPGATGHGVQATAAMVGEATPYVARNVVAILPGSDPQLRHEYVTLTAHNDHVGLTGAPPVDHDSARAYNRVIRPMGADSRPMLDGPRPDPNAPCRQ